MSQYHWVCCHYQRQLRPWVSYRKSSSFLRRRDQVYINIYVFRAIILIVGLGILATYTGYNIGLFRQRYPHIQNLSDAGEILLGPIGREIFGIGQFLFCIFVMGSHLLTFRVMMNTITVHRACSVLFSAVGMILSMILSIPRTMKGMTWISFACKSTIQL